MDVSKRYLLVMLSALCGCTPTARLTNLTPQAPIPEDSVRIMQAVESPDSYSDMAIGLGKMFGFTFIENFRLPYTATSIQDFWRYSDTGYQARSVQ